MRLLLVAVLALLPLTAHAAHTDNLSDDRPDRNAASDDADTPEAHGNEDVVDEAWPYSNPYSPTSATNFDPFAVPLSQRPEVNDRSRLSKHLNDPGPINSVYGHFGSPLFPDSINSRGVTDHPYAMDSSTNLYGRSWRIEGR